MKKVLIISVLGACIILASSTGIFAKTVKSSSSKNYLTFSFFLRPASLGYKHYLFDNLYATGNLDYRSSTKDLEFQVGAAYFIPRKILIFRFYGGAGYQFSRNKGYQYPYVSIGTNFLFLFTEIIHPLRSDMDSKGRFGFCVKF
ncbi:MAG: hypothetical protein JSV96_14160 [Candidatus Aminicenantes bacterium]|nr:MAG: hypothetical protein JSV96_14160 [Candidatus Aminicenantes bacterium]